MIVLWLWLGLILTGWLWREACWWCVGGVGVIVVYIGRKIVWIEWIVDGIFIDGIFVDSTLMY